MRKIVLQEKLMPSDLELLQGELFVLIAKYKKSHEQRTKDICSHLTVFAKSITEID